MPKELKINKEKGLKGFYYGNYQGNTYHFWQSKSNLWLWNINKSMTKGHGKTLNEVLSQTPFYRGNENG